MYVLFLYVPPDSTKLKHLPLHTPALACVYIIIIIIFQFLYLLLLTWLILSAIDYSFPEDGTHRLFRNVWKEFPLHEA